jgi:cell division protein FtsQ
MSRDATPRRRPTPIRGASPLRRSPRTRRASARLAPVQAGALLAMLAAAGIGYGLLNSNVFGATDVAVSGVTWTSEAAVEAAASVEPGANLFTIETGPIEAAVEALPAVLDASVAVGLPATVAIDVVEREAILVWVVDDRRFLVDREGLLFAELAAPVPRGAADLPAISDERADAAGLSVGDALASVDLDAATRLASLEPADLASRADTLDLRVGDENGYVLAARPAGWEAVFGFYTPSLRTPEMIPGQVRFLRSLLVAQEEAMVARVILASETDGTWVPVPSPEASPSPSGGGLP